MADSTQMVGGVNTFHNRNLLREKQATFNPKKSYNNFIILTNDPFYSSKWRYQFLHKTIKYNKFTKIVFSMFFRFYFQFIFNFESLVHISGALSSCTFVFTNKIESL